jgi:hypothetical protein
MRPHRVLGLWCLATLLSIPAAELSSPATGAVPVVAGPWLLVGDDGLRRCGVEIAGPLDADQVRLEHDGRVVPLPVVVRPVLAPARAPTVVVEVLLPAAASGAWTMLLPGRRLAFTATPVPAGDQPVRVAFASASNWPTATDLAAAGEALGGAVSLVVAHGRHSAAHLGHGGWEAGVPVAVLPHPVPEGMRAREQVDAIAVARLGMLVRHGQDGVRWGMLGLPWAGDTAVATRTIARDLSPWAVCLVPSAWYELGLLAPRVHRDQGQVAPLVALCQHLRVPLILTLGGGAGFVSEPVQVIDGQVSLADGGLRVIAATPAGDDLALLPPLVAEALGEPGLIALGADTARLRVVGVGFAVGGDFTLDIRREDEAVTGSGVGRDPLGVDEQLAVRTALTGGDEAGAAARARCRWLTTRQLGMLHLESSDLMRLLAIVEAPGVATLLRHLTRVEDLAEAFAEHHDDLPVPVLAELLLRQIARGNGVDPRPWRRFVATAPDDRVVSALLRAHQDGVDPAMLDLLVERVRAQAAGTTAIAADGLLQHRLMTAVFDATSLSPTVVRPLALALKPRLSPFTVRPVERFLERHGVVPRD